MSTTHTPPGSLTRGTATRQSAPSACLFFFFQAEDGIRYLTVTGVQTCALPIFLRLVPGWETGRALAVMVVGMLALGQSLDSLTMLTGLGDKGTLAAMRGALADEIGRASCRERG